MNSGLEAQSRRRCAREEREGSVDTSASLLLEPKYDSIYPPCVDLELLSNGLQEEFIRLVDEDSGSGKCMEPSYETTRVVTMCERLMQGVRSQLLRGLTVLVSNVVLSLSFLFL